MSELQFRKQAIINKERAAIERGLRKAAQRLVRDLRAAINLPVERVRVNSGDSRNKSGQFERGVYFIRRSQPGEYPRKETGNLRASIDYWEDTENLAVEIGANEDAPYWSDLEYGTENMEARPFVRPRTAAMRQELNQIAGTELKAEFGN